MVHELKTWPEYFAIVWVGRKTFEIRKNDRGFKLGHKIILREYDPETNRYSGRTVTGIITYVTDYEQPPGQVVFSFSVLEKNDMSDMIPELRSAETFPNCCLRCGDFERFGVGDTADGFCQKFKRHADFDSTCDDFDKR